jgi:hypothetical protein
VGLVGGDGVNVQLASDDGIYVRSAGDPSTTISSTLRNGFEVAGAAGHGLYVGRTDANGVHVYSAGGDGVRVESAGGWAGYFGGHVAIGGNASITGDADLGSNASIAGSADIAGDANIAGTLTKGAGAFQIDHPLDPEHKTLSHSFVESPDMMNIYNGNVTTDGEGYATVSLPDYFQVLNRDPRYQLTVIGTFAQAIVAREIEDNQFVIQTDKPNVKVSWQVTGIRQDPYANANRIVVEQDKPLDERGTYLHPEAYGLPKACGAVSCEVEGVGP